MRVKNQALSVERSVIFQDQTSLVRWVGINIWNDGMYDDEITKTELLDLFNFEFEFSFFRGGGQNLER